MAVPSHTRPFRSAIVIPLSGPSAESGRNKGMSQTSAKRVELASCPCSIGKSLHSSERGLALGFSVGDAAAHLCFAAADLQSTQDVDMTALGRRAFIATTAPSL